MPQIDFEKINNQIMNINEVVQINLTDSKDKNQNIIGIYYRYFEYQRTNTVIFTIKGIDNTITDINNTSVKKGEIIENLHLKNINYKNLENNSHFRKKTIIKLLQEYINRNSNTNNIYSNTISELCDVLTKEYPIITNIEKFSYPSWIDHPFDQLTNFTSHIQEISKIENININIDNILYKRIQSYHEYEDFITYRAITHINNNIQLDQNTKLELNAKIHNENAEIICTIIAEHYIENIMGYRKQTYTIKKSELNENIINHYIKYVTEKYKTITSKNINKSSSKIEKHTIEYSFQIYDLLIDILKKYCEKNFILNYQCGNGVARAGLI